MFDDAYFADPYAVWSRLRTAGPVQHRPGIGWLVLGHAAVKELARNPCLSKVALETTRLDGLSAEVKAAASPILARARYSMLRQDPPVHTRLRAQSMSAFTVRSVEAWRPRIEAIAHRLIDQVAASGQMDVVRDFAFPLPAMVIMELLGVPLEDRDRLKSWTADGIEFLGALRTSANPLELTKRAVASQNAMRDYARELVGAKRVKPADDFISALVAVQQSEDGRLDEEEVLAQSILLLAAGHETTTNLIANGLLALLRQPDQMQVLRADPGLTRSAVEEFLRFDPPVQMLARMTTAPIEVAGQPIDAGQRLGLIIAAANRDPSQFAEAGRLDIRRERNDHLAFGFDRHLCLGAQLARLEGQIAFGVLLDRLPDLRLAGQAEDLVWHRNTAFRALRSLPVEWRAAAMHH